SRRDEEPRGDRRAWSNGGGRAGPWRAMVARTGASGASSGGGSPRGPTLWTLSPGQARAGRLGLGALWARGCGERLFQPAARGKERRGIVHEAARLLHFGPHFVDAVRERRVVVTRGAKRLEMAELLRALRGQKPGLHEVPREHRPHRPVRANLEP